MAACCEHDNCASSDRQQDPVYRRVLWAVLALNAGMFVVEVVAGLAAGSASLQADALDFFGDAANYGVSLFVLGMALRYRAMAAIAKGASMGLFGLWVVGTVIWHAIHGTVRRTADHGCHRLRGARGQRSVLRPVVHVPDRGLEYAFGMDLHTQRRTG